MFFLIPPALTLAGPTRAQPAPAAVVEGFHDTLLSVMRDAARLGVAGRFARLEPAMQRAFDLAAMTRLAVGPPWSGFSAPDRAALTDAFSRWSIATYAARFDGYSGESFRTLESRTLPNGAVLVRTALVRTGGEAPVALGYLLRGNPPRIVDIYLDGTISELASRRAEFTALLREGGATRLAAELRARSDRLMAG